MAMGWGAAKWQAERLEERRENRLVHKLQKAGAIGRREEVEQLGSWRQRFRAVARMRAEHHPRKEV